MTAGQGVEGYPFRSAGLVVALPVAPFVGCFAGLALWMVLNGALQSPDAFLGFVQIASYGYVYTLPVSVVLALAGFSVLRLMGRTSYLAYALAGLVLSPASLFGAGLVLNLGEETVTFFSLAVIVSLLTALTFRLLLEPFRKRPKQAIN